MTLGDNARTGDPTGSESEREIHEVRHDPTSDDPVWEAITEVVAASTGADPSELRPLYEVVDPDALDRVFAPTNSDGERTTRTGHVVFRYEGCRVRVTADGCVVTTPAEDE